MHLWWLDWQRNFTICSYVLNTSSLPAPPPTIFHTLVWENFPLHKFRHQLHLYLLVAIHVCSLCCLWLCTCDWSSKEWRNVGRSEISAKDQGYMVQVLSRFSNDPLFTSTHIHNNFLHFLFLVNMKSMPIIQ